MIDKKTTNSKPKVSVLMITYNHEGFIQDAIESILMQKTDFSLELVIGEDYSTDGTKRICLEYQKKYPKIIRVLDAGKNLGVKENFLRTLRACKGEYIAYLEGDDFWTDPNKLQIQVDFLDANPNFALCFHRIKTLNMITKEEYVLSDKNIKEISVINDLCKGNYICANSVVFRNEDERFKKFEADSNVCDWVLWVYKSQSGNIKYFNNIMSTYRVHEGGVFSKQNDLYRYEISLKAAENWKRLIGNTCDTEYKEFAGFCVIEIIKYLLIEEPADYNSISKYLQKLSVLIKDNPALRKKLRWIPIKGNGVPKENKVLRIIKFFARPVRMVYRKIRYLVKQVLVK